LSLLARAVLTPQLIFLRPHTGKRNLQLLSQSVQCLNRIAAKPTAPRGIRAEETGIGADEAWRGAELTQLRSVRV
jgi:hypothetical protein